MRKRNYEKKNSKMLPIFLSFKILKFTLQKLADFSISKNLRVSLTDFSTSKNLSLPVAYATSGSHQDRVILRPTGHQKVKDPWSGSCNGPDFTAFDRNSLQFAAHKESERAAIRRKEGLRSAFGFGYRQIGCVLL